MVLEVFFNLSDSEVELNRILLHLPAVACREGQHVQDISDPQKGPIATGIILRLPAGPGEVEVCPQSLSLLLCLQGLQEQDAAGHRGAAGDAGDDGDGDGPSIGRGRRRGRLRSSQVHAAHGEGTPGTPVP